MSRGLGRVERRVLDICTQLATGEIAKNCYRGGNHNIKTGSAYRLVRDVRHRHSNPLEYLPEHIVDLLEAGALYKEQDPKCPAYEHVPSAFRRAVRSLKRKRYLEETSGKRFVSVTFISDTHKQPVPETDSTLERWRSGDIQAYSRCMWDKWLKAGLLTDEEIAWHEEAVSYDFHDDE